jgi:hypothetical protein
LGRNNVQTRKFRQTSSLPGSNRIWPNGFTLLDGFLKYEFAFFCSKVCCIFCFCGMKVIDNLSVSR